MKRIWGISLGIVFVALVGGYYLVPVQPDITPPEMHKIAGLVKSKLNDPYTAHITYRGWGRIRKLDAQGRPEFVLFKPSDGKPPGSGNFVWAKSQWYCGLVNAKNSFGAYAGQQYFAANPVSGQAFVGTDAIERAQERGIIHIEAKYWCTDSWPNGDGERNMFEGVDM